VRTSPGYFAIGKVKCVIHSAPSVPRLPAYVPRISMKMWVAILFPGRLLFRSEVERNETRLSAGDVDAQYKKDRDKKQQCCI